MIDAYESYGVEAVQRLKDYYELNFTPTLEQLRQRANVLLGRETDSGGDNDNLLIEHAKLLVARSHGFESWDETLKDVESL